MPSEHQQPVLWQLFLNGPTYDGDLVSKIGRDELFKLGFVMRGKGYNWLTKDGVLTALNLNYDIAKEKIANDRKYTKYPD